MIKDSRQLFALSKAADMNFKHVYHPRSAEQLATLRRNPAQAVLLIGLSGAGKGTAARELAETVLDVATGSANHHPYIKILSPRESTSISIEQVRDIEHFLSRKVPGKQSTNRIIIIEDSQLLGLEAQNALLKTLEEPPQATTLILTATNPQALLATVRSRLQTITLQRPAQNDLEAHFKAAGFELGAIRAAYTISTGLPGLMQALLSQIDHPQRLAAEIARELLQSSIYERLLRVDELAKQRQNYLDTLIILQRMAHLSLQTAHGASSQRWQRILQASYRAAELLEQNTQAKLTLISLMFDLS